MNLQQAKVLLKKINTLNDSLSLDNGPIASIERDLMLSYIRQLYEVYLDGASNGQAGTSVTTASRVNSVNNGPELEIVPPPQEKEPAPEPPKRRYTPPKIIEIPDSPVESAKVSAPPPSPPPIQRTTPAPQPTPKAAPVYATGSNNPKVKALFDQREAKELSEKLSLQPLRDLTKGLSINDRLLYTNDLFDKDANVFNAALKKLNDMDTMDQARTFLEEQAERYQWTDGEKEDVARDFIKHVRRRFV